MGHRSLAAGCSGGPIEEEINIMAKLFLCAGVISLLAACANMSGTSVSRSSGTSDTSTMGAPGYIGSSGPIGASGGGPN
jgi:hypothetical protein